MTPERLQEIRERCEYVMKYADHSLWQPPPTPDVSELLAYVDELKKEFASRTGWMPHLS